MRNVLAHVTRADRSMVAEALRTVFAQPDRTSAGKQLAVVAEAMAPRWSDAAELPRTAKEKVLAYMAFPIEHWTRIYSTNPLERLSKEIKRRTNVVAIFPDVPSVKRLVGAILADSHGEWQVRRRYLSQESMRKLSMPEKSLRITAPLHLEPIRYAVNISNALQGRHSFSTT